jgi:hypothetical protein
MHRTIAKIAATVALGHALMIANMMLSTRLIVANAKHILFNVDERRYV